MAARTGAPGPPPYITDRRAGDRRAPVDRRRRVEPVAVDRRWPFDRRLGDRRDSLTSRLLRYVG